VIAGGKILLAHRALLAHRSPVLRDLIVEESPLDLATNKTEPTQILLPELHADSAKALLFFLYTDALPASTASDPALLQRLRRSGVEYRMPRLTLLCESLLLALERLKKGVDGSDDNEDDEDDDGEQEEEVEREGTDTSHDTNADADAVYNRRRSSSNSHSHIELPPPTLSRDLASMLGDTNFADIRFVAEGREIFAHQFILQAR